MAVDVGSIGTARDVEYYIVNFLGKNLGNLRFIASTHFHIDHIGGIGYLVERTPCTTKVLFNYRVKDYIHAEKKISLVRNWFVGFPPATITCFRCLKRLSHLFFESMSGIPLPWIRNFIRLPFSEKRIIYYGGNGRRRYDLGFDGWEVFETPGHTEDSISFFNKKTGELICGDLIINTLKGKRGKLNRFYWDRKVIQESFYCLLSTIEPKIIYPGHGNVISDKVNALLKVELF